MASSTGSGGFEPIRLRVTRGGTVVGEGVGTNAAAARVPAQAGDVITIERPVGTVVDTFAFDGTPTATPCAGAQTLQGGRGPDARLTLRVLDPAGTGSSPVRQRGILSAPSPTTYAAIFPAPLVLGQRVRAVMKYVATSERYVVSNLTAPVGSCVPAAAPDTTRPTGTLLKLSAKKLRTAIRALLKGTFSSQVRVSEPSRVAQTLVAADGTLPAKAAAAKKGRKATVIAKGKATARKAGTVTVRLKPTAAGKKKLKRAKRITLVLITTLTDGAGNTRTLKATRLTARR